MALDKEMINKLATFFGYTVYVISIIFGFYIVFADPVTLMQTKPTLPQLAGLLIICYGIVQCIVTFYNRLPPLEVKTSNQIAINKANLREFNDRKSREKKPQN